MLAIARLAFDYSGNNLRSPGKSFSLVESSGLI